MAKRRLSKAEAGRLGGLSTLRRHGQQHFAEIGRAGAAATWKKYVRMPLGTSDYSMVPKQVAFDQGWTDAKIKELRRTYGHIDRRSSM